ncbi:MAG TPA: acyl-CoA dehydrogenase family protein [Myxococcota bacterium]|nr:acyl-CoA dehydrogenase family protein [Myxococcota bacterium]
MDFDLTPDEQAFSDEVDAWLAENHDPAVMDPTRENFAQLVDTPERRAFMKKLAAKGWLGMTWPKEYGGQETHGIYEFILNEALSRVGAPQIGKGVGIIGKTLIRHGSEKQKREFLPKILAAEVEFALGYSEPQAGSDAANMQLKAVKVDGGWVLNGQKIWTTSAHFADWYWVGARTDPEKPKHDGISLFLIPMDNPGLEIQSMPTIAKDTTNQVFFTDVFVPDDYLVGERGRGFQYISEALDLERFTLYTLSPVAERTRLLIEYVRSASRDGVPLRKDPRIRARIARISTDTAVAQALSKRFVCAAKDVHGKPPTAEASQYKLFSTELGQRVCREALDVMGAAGQLREGQDEAPLRGRFEHAYRATAIDTLGGGSSEVQKNIIARRHLGLPKNF